MKALLLAAMPVVLMDGTAPDLNHWLRIEPAIVAAVECRQALPLHVLDGIAPNAPGSWSLTPARSFTAFGLPGTSRRAESAGQWRNQAPPGLRRFDHRR